MRLQAVVRVSFVAACMVGCDPSTNQAPTDDDRTPIAVDVDGGSPAMQPDAATDEPETQSLYRVELVRSAEGAISIREILLSAARTDLPAAPIAPTGDAFVVAYRGDKVLGMDVARFPRVATAESGDAASGLSSTTLELEQSAFTAMIAADEQADRITIELADGTIIAEELGAQIPDIKLASTRTLQNRMADLFPHIRVLSPEVAEEQLPQELREYAGPAVQPDELDLERLEAALRRASPATIAAVTTIVFTRGGGTAKPYWGLNWGPTIFVSLSADNQAAVAANPHALSFMLAHEAAHCFTFLTNDVAGDAVSLARWPKEIAAVAERNAVALGLSEGLTTSWSEMHQTGVDMGVAKAYVGEVPTLQPSASTAVDLGFASPYAATNALEDIAEVTAHVQVPDYAIGSGMPCEAMRASPPYDFPLSHAMVLAKIEFARALRLITAQAYDACVGSLGLTGPQGLHLRDSEGGGYQAGLNVRGGRYTNDDGHSVLNVLSETASGDLTLVEVAAGKSGGLGLHRLDDHGSLLWGELGLNSVIISDSDDRNFLSQSGLVLVTEVSDERIQGTIFFLSMRNAVRTTDRFALGTFRVDKPSRLE